MMSARSTLVLAVNLLTGGIANAATRYSITEIPPPPGAIESDVCRINNNGLIVGQSPASDGIRSRSYTWQDGHFTELFPQPDTFAYPLAVNNVGQIVGGVWTGSGTGSAFIWADGGSTALDLGVTVSADAHGINSSGAIVGHYYTDSARPFFWRTGQVTELPIPSGFRDAVAIDISDSDQIILNAYRFEESSPTVFDSFLFYEGKLTQLVAAQDGQTTANRINARGQIAGVAEDATGFHGAVIWSDLEPIYLPKPRDASGSTALSLNNAGQIVGAFDRGSSGGTHAALWQDGSVYDLNDLIPSGSGWLLYSANDMNDNGLIVGTGYLEGQRRGFLLTPIPDPAALPLFALASATLLARKPRTRAAQ